MKFKYQATSIQDSMNEFNNIINITKVICNKDSTEEMLHEIYEASKNTLVLVMLLQHDNFGTKDIIDIVNKDIYIAILFQAIQHKNCPSELKAQVISDDIIFNKFIFNVNITVEFVQENLGRINKKALLKNRNITPENLSKIINFYNKYGDLL